MTDTTHIENFEFRVLQGADSTSQFVPVSVLTGILKNAQDIIYLLALQVEGREVRERARIPQEIENRYTLMCQIPRPGSYIMPVTLGNPDPAILIIDDRITATASIFRNCGDLLSQRDATGFRALIPDPQLRNRVLEGYHGLAPKPGDDWLLEVRDSRDVFGRFDQTFSPFFQEVRQRWTSEPQARITTVTGRLNKIDFGKHEVSIIHPQTHKALQCYYVDEFIEEMLYENRRDMIQVTGTVVLDDSGMPKEITDVQEIRDLNLSPFAIHEFVCDKIKLQFVNPLVLTPELDDSQQFLCLKDEQLGIDVFAMTRERLLSDLLEQLALLWKEYANEVDESLSAESLALKRALQSAIRREG